MTGRTKLNVVTAGAPELPPMVFLHGFLGSAQDWRPVMTGLCSSRFCVAVDLPGHGQSRPVRLPGAYSVRAMADAVRDTVAALGLRPCALTGYSMGGRLALYLAVTDPGFWSALVLESASPGLAFTAERRERRRADEALARRLENGDFRQFLEDWYAQPVFASLRANRSLLREVIASRAGNDPAELARCLRGLSTGRQPALWDRLGGLRGPVLLVAGEHDRKYLGLTTKMQTLCPGSLRVVVPGAGHNAHLESPAEFVRILKAFPKNAGGPPGKRHTDEGRPSGGSKA